MYIINFIKLVFLISITNITYLILIWRLSSVLFIWRCCFRCGVDKSKFSVPQDLMCQSFVACVEIQNVYPDDKFYDMTRNSNPLFSVFLLSLCAWKYFHILTVCGHVGSWIYLFESDLFTQITSVEFCSIHYPRTEDNWFQNADSWCSCLCRCKFDQLSSAAYPRIEDTSKQS